MGKENPKLILLMSFPIPGYENGWDKMKKYYEAVKYEIGHEYHVLALTDPDISKLEFTVLNKLSQKKTKELITKLEEKFKQ